TLVGLTRDEAQARLETDGFDLGDVVERPSQSRAGQVIDSRPAAGQDAPVPSAVAIVVSAGPGVVLVPNVVGRSVAQARTVLENAGLSVADVRTPQGDLLSNDAAIV